MADKTDVKALRLEIDASVELLRSRMAEGEREISRWRRKTETELSNVDKAFAAVGRGIGPLRVGLAGLSTVMAGIGVSGAVRGFLALADQSKQMQAQLKLATGQFGSYAQAQEDAERIAAVTRNGLSETVALYGNFLRASQPLGKSQADAARATETFAKALKIGGAGAAEAASATLQFGQALASGVLRGDEFNSIAEASPRILRLLADSLGVASGDLRAMAAEGKLTSDVLYRALTDRKFTASIDQEFKQLPKTFDEAMVQVHNAAVTAFGAFDRGGQFSTAIASFVGDGADGFRELTKVAEEQGRQIRGIYDGLEAAWEPFLDAGKEAMRLIGLEGKSTAELIGDYISFQLGNLQTLANFPFGGMFGFKPFTFGDDYDERRRRSVSDAIGRAAGERHLQRRKEFYDATHVNVGSSREEYLGIYDLGLEKRPGTASPASDSGKGKKGGRAATRKPTDADLSPMELILRDIGKTPLPLDIEITGEKELVDAKANLEAMSKGLAEIGDFAKTVNIGDVLDAEEQRRLERFSAGFADDLSRGLADAIVYGDNLGDVLVNSLKRAAAEALSSGLFDLLTGKGIGKGNFLGTLASGASSIFGGFREGGGPVSPGKAYVVGEKRPEVFVPNTAGTIIPSIAAGRYQPPTIHQHFSVNAQGSVLAAGLIAEMQAIGIRAAAGGAVIAERRANDRARRTLR